MKNLIYSVFALILIAGCTNQPEVTWISTTENTPWQKLDAQNIFTESSATPDIVVYPEKEQQQINGFGSCFNELGWTSLSELNETDRENILKELFAPGVGANFTICRMPVAANDFASNWYSFDETDGDFEMKDFSIEHDQSTLIPFIKSAKKYNPGIQIWASPWSPPAWMKYNKHYASTSSMRIAEMANRFMEQRKQSEDTTQIGGFFANVADPAYQNDLPMDKEGYEGTDMFIQEDKYLQAYALYFKKFIKAYQNEGIDIFAVMPQNEFNSAQVFPSCTWTAASLANFIGSYLGPAMEEVGVEVYFGTMERANAALVDTILQDEKSGPYIKGVGFQWAGKDALPTIHKEYPNLEMFQTEQECGDGKNDWAGFLHSWDLMKHYLNNGVSVYEYWNTSLLEGGISRWGWAQNSLVVVDAATKTYRYSLEYYLLKHASHFVLPGAKKIEVDGSYDDLLAFKNPDNSVIIVIANQSGENKLVNIKIGDLTLSPELPANSVNTLKM